MPDKYQCGDRSFPTKAAWKSSIQSILRAYAPGEHLASNDCAFISALALRHPSAVAKIGAGISSISVESSLRYASSSASNGFWIHRQDGTRTDFSYLQCLSPLSVRTKVMLAFRHSIEQEIVRYKRSIFQGASQVLCPIAGTFFVWDEMEIDHYPRAFIDLVKMFLTQEGRVCEAIPLESEDGEIGAHFCEKDLESRWGFFHHAHANLRCISMVAHRAVTKGHYDLPTRKV